MIRLEQLCLHAGAFRLEDASLEISAGAYGMLMGTTGSGKTTLLEAICGLRPVERGSIWLNDREVTRLRPAERGIGYVPQDRALFQTMSVREHLAFALVVRRWAAPQIDHRVRELAAMLGLEKLLDRKPGRLSGGEAQRVALGRALASAPSLLLLDEPLSAFDEETREEFQEALSLVQRQTRVTVLHVTHSSAEAQRLGQIVFRISAGRLVRQKPATSGPDQSS